VAAEDNKKRVKRCFRLEKQKHNEHANFGVRQQKKFFLWLAWPANPAAAYPQRVPGRKDPAPIATLKERVFWPG